MPKTQCEYLELVETLNACAHAYYTLDQPSVSDNEYDLMYQTLLKFEQSNPLLVVAHSPSQRIGDALLDGFESFSHHYLTD